MTTQTFLLAIVAATLAGPAFADQRPVPPRTLTGPVHLDQRYRHDHYYPARGFVFAALPAGSISVGHGGATWFFHAGVWLRPAGTRFVVAVPPPGIVVPYLPPAYVPLWIAGTPYYYANDVYYAAAPGGYAVVAPPPVAVAAQPVATAPTYILYPRNGQNNAQAESDRAACNAWAGDQPGGRLDWMVFQRAFEACMDGRGYTVR